MRSPTSFPVSDNETTDDIREEMFAKRGCCFVFPCFGSSQPSAAGGSEWWQRIRTADKCEADERWWVCGWRKLREWSELIAGPKWKTFIRRFGRHYGECCGGGILHRQDHGKFRYDPLSYSLNFDDGLKQNGHFDDGFPYRDFSARFTGPPSLPVSTKCSLDFDNDGVSHALPTVK